MAESKGYYTYGDVKDFIITYNPSQGCYVISKNKSLMVSKNAISSLPSTIKTFDKCIPTNVLNKSINCHYDFEPKGANLHIPYIDENDLGATFETENISTNQCKVYTPNIGFYEITSIGQIARHNLNISATPNESIIKINNVEQSSYNGYETEEVPYEVSCDGYKTEDGIVVLSNDMELNIELLLEVHLTINVNPTDAIVTVNGIEGKEHILGKGSNVTVIIDCPDYKTYTNTFIIEEDTVLDVELKSNDINIVFPGSTLPSSVTYNNVSSFSNNGSYLYSTNTSHSSQGKAYIKFTTPNKTTTISAQAYTSSENNFDFGVIYVGTSTYYPSVSNARDKTTDGKGFYLYTGSGSNSSYSTYTGTLQPNTTYYISLSYVKDGSGSYYSDRFYVKKITFTAKG